MMTEHERWLLVATYNQGKIGELRELLAELPFRLCGLSDFETTAEVEETGSTFLENAQLKARSYARQTGVWALSDDSGLEVEALGGAPGVYSARYAGPEASDAENISKLLSELEATNDEDRRARFVCAMTVADEEGRVLYSAEGVCAGRIAPEPRGGGGFGYDPVFIPEGFEQTFGELPSGVKREISHRARAIVKINRFLRDFTVNELDQ